MKLATINIERSKHLARVEFFLRAQKPDVVCLQEVAAHDLDYFADLFGGHENIVWAPMCTGHWPESPEPQTIGIAIASPHGLGSITASYYHGTDDPLPEFKQDENGVVHASISHLLLAANVTKDGETCRFACAHHTWTKDGVSTDVQMEDTRALLAAAKEEGECVLAGDFNAPRGRPAFKLLADKFKDNIPASITTSIDASLHRAGAIPYMVDGIFTTPAYTATDVTQHFMVSDHTAFTATITKA